jgi:hypothetical protein
MASLFYREHFQPYPITLLLLEHFSVLMEEQLKLELAYQDSFEVLATQVLLDTKTLKHPPTEAEMIYLFTRIKAIQEEEAEPKSPTSGNGKKLFGSHYLEWLDTLDSEKLCLFASDYDYERARHLYCKTDRDAVTDMARLRAESDWQGKLASFEACLFGFGGGYGDSDERVIDMKEDPKGAEASIRSMGF